MSSGGARVVPRPAELWRFGPHTTDHWAALRVGLANAGPLLLLYALGRDELMIYAVFGAFASVYARNAVHLTRLRVQLVAGVALVLSIAAGGLVGLSPQRGLLIVPVAAVWVAAVALLGDRVRWTPPGPLFQLFGLAAIAMIGAPPHQAALGVLVAVGTVAWALLIGYGGRVVRRLSRMPHPYRPGAQPPASPQPWGDAALFGVGVLVAGAIPTLVGIGHPYWAMVSVVAGLSGAGAAQRVLRATHRFVGTLVGLALGWGILALHPSTLATVLVVIALTAAIELFVLRNYSAAMAFMTPLVLLMGALGGAVDVDELIAQRAIETLIGVAVAIALALLAHRWAAPRRRTL